MAKLLEVPDGVLATWSEAQEFVVYMENHIDGDDPQQRPYLSLQRFDKLRELLSHELAGAASALALLEKYSNQRHSVNRAIRMVHATEQSLVELNGPALVEVSATPEDIGVVLMLGPSNLGKSSLLNFWLRDATIFIVRICATVLTVCQ